MSSSLNLTSSSLNLRTVGEAQSSSASYHATVSSGPTPDASLSITVHAAHTAATQNFATMQSSQTSSATSFSSSHSTPGHVLPRLMTGEEEDKVADSQGESAAEKWIKKHPPNKKYAEYQPRESVVITDGIPFGSLASPLAIDRANGKRCFGNEIIASYNELLNRDLTINEVWRHLSSSASEGGALSPDLAALRARLNNVRQWITGQNIPALRITKIGEELLDAHARRSETFIPDSQLMLLEVLLDNPNPSPRTLDRFIADPSETDSGPLAINIGQELYNTYADAETPRTKRSALRKIGKECESVAKNGFFTQSAPEYNILNSMIAKFERVLAEAERVDAASRQAQNVEDQMRVTTVMRNLAQLSTI